MATTGCAVGDGDGDKEEARTLPEELAVRPQPLVVGAEPPTATTGSPLGGGNAPGAASTTTATTATTPATARSGDGATTTTSPRPYRQLADVADRTGDAGLQARPYGDLVRLRLDDDGTRARFTVEVAGDIPSSLAGGEVMGIGVDLYRGTDEESEYQVFADGGSDGWHAYLDTPSGIVQYPGTFEMGGNTLVFTVPWSSLGGRRTGSVAAFADWSKGRAAVVADASQDHAPDRGSTPVVL